MNYEKAYKEALERARDLHDNHPLGQPLTWTTCEKIFPELRESEDERIRLSLMSFLNSLSEMEYPSKEEYRKWWTWLEKQGEPTDINPSEFDLHLNKLLKQFETLPKEELASSLSFYLNVVQNDGTYREEKQGEQEPVDYNEELKKCRENPLYFFDKYVKVKLKEQKPTWSEEDELAIERLVDTIEIARSFKYGKPKAVYTDEILDSLINWLKSIKSKKHWKPSEEQMEALWNVISHTVNSEEDVDTITELSALYEELKNL